jgi:hypothetical protein
MILKLIQKFILIDYFIDFLILINKNKNPNIDGARDIRPYFPTMDTLLSIFGQN